MPKIIETILAVVSSFFTLYIILYTTYLLMSVLIGAMQLYTRERMMQVRNELKHDYYMPISILVPAHNEEVTIVDSVKSLLALDYRLYEIIVVDDGSTDNTAGVMIDTFKLKKVDRPIHRRVKCKDVKAIYEVKVGKILVTLITKENGGKGDALNMGINASQYPYFLCMDADSVLQSDSLEKIMQPLMADDNIVAIGGLIHVAQSVERNGGEITGYHLPRNVIISMQVVEYDRSFLASRILMDGYSGNLIISGAFGLFNKATVIAAGGYDTNTLGEDMELVVKLHVFCRNNNIPYSIRYEPNACCWSQAPTSLGDLMKQRRRWYLGLVQCMTKYRVIFANPRFGLVSFVSYLYYMLFELASPVIECVGIITTFIAFFFGALNGKFMLQFLLMYSFYGAMLTITAFFQRVFTQNMKIYPLDVVRAVIMCFLESVFFRYVLSFGRMAALVGYRRNKSNWGTIKRVKQSS
ncbi:MAG: glycosyltransferase family 2 protein [Oscillospiraceae bacterium]|nr:glycosyltransferase family 2 protein [Oscillospiraceae bacterium]